MTLDVLSLSGPEPPPAYKGLGPESATHIDRHRHPLALGKVIFNLGVRCGLTLRPRTSPSHHAIPSAPCRLSGPPPHSYGIGVFKSGAQKPEFLTQMLQISSCPGGELGLGPTAGQSPGLHYFLIPHCRPQLLTSGPPKL